VEARIVVKEKAAGGLRRGALFLEMTDPPLGLLQPEMIIIIKIDTAKMKFGTLPLC
jgi:hypothetical protein